MSFFSEQRKYKPEDSHKNIRNPELKQRPHITGFPPEPFQKLCKPCTYRKPEKPNCREEERTSVSAPSAFRGSLTVEAALVYSLLIFLLLVCLSLFSALQFQMKVQYVLDRELRSAAILKESESQTVFQIRNALRKEEKNMPVFLTLEGHIEVSAWKEEISEQDVLLAEAVYEIRPSVRVFGTMKWNGMQLASRRLWNGEEKLTGSSGEGTGSSEYVYITRYGTVYHKDRNCSYLNPAVRQVSFSELKSLRNADGSRYKACQYCARGKNTPGTVYITSQGECYHYKRSCGGLRRWVIKVSLDSVSGRKPCSRCTGG